MHGLALWYFYSEHDASYWEMSCDEWNQELRFLVIRILTLMHTRYLIDHFRTKVSDERCETWQLGRK